MKSFLIAGLLGLLVSFGAQAQTILGNVEINGRNAIIYDDFSWKFEGDADNSNKVNLTDCGAIGDNHVFCGDKIGWGATSKLTPDSAGSYRYDDRNYATIILESVGSSDGLTLDFMENSIIRNASIGAGIGEADVERFETTDMTVNGHPGRKLVYGPKIDGLNFVYFNRFFITPKETPQMISFTIASTPDAATAELHAAAVTELRSR
jgi:hypothetical protein